MICSSSDDASKIMGIVLENIPVFSFWSPFYSSSFSRDRDDIKICVT